MKIKRDHERCKREGRLGDCERVLFPHFAFALHRFVSAELGYLPLSSALFFLFYFSFSKRDSTSGKKEKKEGAVCA